MRCYTQCAASRKNWRMHALHFFVWVACVYPRRVHVKSDLLRRTATRKLFETGLGFGRLAREPWATLHATLAAAPASVWTGDDDHDDDKKDSSKKLPPLLAFLLETYERLGLFSAEQCVKVGAQCLGFIRDSSVH